MVDDLIAGVVICEGAFLAVVIIILAIVLLDG